MTNIKKGWAASDINPDREWHDLGGGWNKSEAEKDLIEQGADMNGIEIYEAQTTDNWETWSPIKEG